MFWQLVLVAAAVGVAFYRWSRRRLYRLAEEIPCPLKSYPVIGIAHMFIGNSQDRMETLQRIGRVTNKQGGLLSAWLGNRLFISMTDPAGIEVVSKACLDKDEFTMKFTRTAIGNGLSSAPVNIWHPRRKINAPFFSVKNLHRLVPLFHQQSSIMVNLMQAELGEFPIWKYMVTLTFDTVGETAAGLNMSSQTNPEHFLLSSINEVMQMLSKRMLQPWLHPDLVYQALPVYKRFQRHVQHAYRLYKRSGSHLLVLDQKIIVSGGSDMINYLYRQIYEEVEANEKNNDWSNFLEMLVQLEGLKGYSDVEIREEVLVMIVAGSDTSATAASFTSVLLSRYPEVQDRVYEELLEVLGDSNRAVTPEDLPRLKYLEAVIKESLRLYPPVPVVAREVHNDVVLPSGVTLVKGTSVGLHIWGAHRYPDYWGDDAEIFRPERFLESPLKHPAQFIPFSYSARGCIGSTYAMLFVKTVLANLLRRYRLLPPRGACADLQGSLPVKFNIMMKAVDDFIVRVEDRNKTSR